MCSILDMVTNPPAMRKRGRRRHIAAPFFADVR
jgi:hypothetical protein